MNILIVHAHENPLSFCSSIKDEMVVEFRKKGHRVIISDLYAMGFNPVASARDFKSASGSDYFKLQNEQKHAAENGLFTDDLAIEMQKVEDCDLLVFNFPLWWFSMPAILKGWVDRVFAFGFSYGGKYSVYEKGRFKGKKAICVVTTGGPESMYNANGAHKLTKEQLLQPINHNVFYFNGFTPLESFVVFGAARITNEERMKKLPDAVKFIEERW